MRLTEMRHSVCAYWLQGKATNKTKNQGKKLINEMASHIYEKKRKTITPEMCNTISRSHICVVVLSQCAKRTECTWLYSNFIGKNAENIENTSQYYCSLLPWIRSVFSAGRCLSVFASPYFCLFHLNSNRETIATSAPGTESCWCPHKFEYVFVCVRAHQHHFGFVAHSFRHSCHSNKWKCTFDPFRCGC